MSHPDPRHDPENVYPHDDYKPSPRKKTVKDLKAMINQPASKAWFAKHGSPKSKVLKSKMK